MALLRKERVVSAFLADGRDWPVTGTNNGIVWQREQAFAVGAECVCVRDFSSAHGAGEERIPNDSDGALEAADDVGDAPLAMPPRQASCDL